MKINWTLKAFHELTAAELYAIMQLRNEVFVVEQNCVYQDADGKDQASLHFCGWVGDELVAYTRIIPPGISYAEASIGRVVTSTTYRKTGAGRKLMEESIKQTLERFKVNSIKIGAQVYLTRFYESLGFKQSSGEYMEDGIPHIEMILNK
ncbi:MAG TPA: GNAT family N-acetyltransferase [Ferruginibacter sp.]|jgi:ElaA protein|nr:GNAT family N-acetyltransferase [Ferruginibacter sp.]